MPESISVFNFTDNSVSLYDGIFNEGENEGVIDCGWIERGFDSFNLLTSLYERFWHEGGYEGRNNGVIDCGQGWFQ